MKIDFDHHKGNQIADDLQLVIQHEYELSLIRDLKPEFSMDGNMYCFTYPNHKGLPNECVQGFGETAYKAMLDFNNNFYNRKAGIQTLKTPKP